MSNTSLSAQSLANLASSSAASRLSGEATHVLALLASVEKQWRPCLRSQTFSVATAATETSGTFRPQALSHVEIGSQGRREPDDTVPMEAALMFSDDAMAFAHWSRGRQVPASDVDILSLIASGMFSTNEAVPDPSMLPLGLLADDGPPQAMSGTYMLDEPMASLLDESWAADVLPLQPGSSESESELCSSPSSDSAIESAGLVAALDGTAPWWRATSGPEWFDMAGDPGDTLALPLVPDHSTNEAAQPTLSRQASPQPRQVAHARPKTEKRRTMLCGTKRKRQVWTADDYRALIDAHCAGGDVGKVADSLRMPLGTAKRIIRHYNKDSTYVGPRPRGGPHHRLYDRNTVLLEFIPWVERPENCDAALDDMRWYLLKQCHMKQCPSRTTLAKWLEGEIIVVNRISSPVQAHVGGKKGGKRVQTSSLKAANAQLAPWDGQLSASTIIIGEATVSIWSKKSRINNSADDVSVSAAVASCRRNVMATIFLAFLPTAGVFLTEVVSGCIGKFDLSKFCANALRVLGSRQAIPVEPTFIVDPLSLLEEPHALTTKLQEQASLLRGGASPVRVLKFDAGRGFANPIHAHLAILHARIHFEHDSRRDAILATPETATWEEHTNHRAHILDEIIKEALNSAVSL